MSESANGAGRQMRITFLGHAGFIAETHEVIVVMDPWLSPDGAFDSSWFQYPRNHHLAALVQEKLADPSRERYLYISHEHKDHLDWNFLRSLSCRDFTVLVADFRRTYLKDAFAQYGCRRVIACEEGEAVPIPGGYVKIYPDDSELNRDSAVLLRASGATFLNLNDCRIVDALPMIAHEEGPIDTFAFQFSGAGWHPTCYAYPRDVYAEIARKKVRAKFAGVLHAIKTVKPRTYIASAGPPCFLDPTLQHLNFEPVNIFPRAPAVLQFLADRLGDTGVGLPDMMPGDVLDVASGEIVEQSPQRVDEEGHADYVRSYASLYEGFFAERRRDHDTWFHGGSEGRDTQLLERLRGALRVKLDELTLHERVLTPLYFRLEDAPGRMLRVDFPAREIEIATSVGAGSHYTIGAPSWEVARALDGQVTWDDFSLTFRMRLDREPDVYQTVVQGFLRLEPEDMNRFCSKLLNIESNQERIVVEANGTRYAVNRYCPHQGGDLTYAWVEDGRYLTCPRHQWQFDLENGGASRRNDGSIDAVCLDED